MWQETQFVVGYNRFIAKLWVFVGPVPSAKITIADHGDERKDHFQFVMGDRASVASLFSNIKEACLQNDSNGWTVMLSLYSTAKTKALSKSDEELELEILGDELARTTESKLELYGVF